MSIRLVVEKIFKPYDSYFIIKLAQDKIIQDLQEGISKYTNDFSFVFYKNKEKKLFTMYVILHCVRQEMHFINVEKDKIHYYELNDSINPYIKYLTDY